MICCVEMSCRIYGIGVPSSLANSQLQGCTDVDSLWRLRVCKGAQMNQVVTISPSVLAIFHNTQEKFLGKKITKKLCGQKMIILPRVVVALVHLATVLSPVSHVTAASSPTLPSMLIMLCWFFLLNVSHSPTVENRVIVF